MRITFPSSKILTRLGWYRRTGIPPGSGRDLRRDSYGIPPGSHAECLRYPATVLVKIPMGDRPEEKSVSAYEETCVSCTVYLFLRDHQEGNDNEHGPSKAKFNLKKKRNRDWDRGTLFKMLHLHLKSVKTYITHAWHKFPLKNPWQWICDLIVFQWQ